jgi:hypothetical protein
MASSHSKSYVCRIPFSLPVNWQGYITYIIMTVIIIDVHFIDSLFNDDFHEYYIASSERMIGK